MVKVAGAGKGRATSQASVIEIASNFNNYRVAGAKYR